MEEQSVLEFQGRCVKVFRVGPCVSCALFCVFSMLHMNHELCIEVRHRGLTTGFIVMPT
jgi:hypothetical protein